MKFELKSETAELLEKVKEFTNKEILPNETTYYEQTEAGGRWCVPQIMEDMKAKAKKQGLWNLFLPESDLGCLLYTSPSPRDRG